MARPHKGGSNLEMLVFECQVLDFDDFPSSPSASLFPLSAQRPPRYQVDATVFWDNLFRPTLFAFLTSDTLATDEPFDNTKLCGKEGVLPCVLSFCF